MIRDYFRTRRQLIADRTTLRTLVDEKDAQIRDAGEAIAHAQDAYQRARNLAADRSNELIRKGTQIQRQADTIAAQQDQLAAIREELAKLRGEIAQLERGERPTFGMARYLDRPLVWQTADAIREDAAHVRREDV